MDHETKTSIERAASEVTKRLKREVEKARQDYEDRVHSLTRHAKQALRLHIIREGIPNADIQVWADPQPLARHYVAFSIYEEGVTEGSRENWELGLI